MTFEVLHLECSPRPAGTSTRLGQRLMAALNERFGGALKVTHRPLGVEPLPAISAAYAESLVMPGDEAKRRFGAQLAVSDELIDELKRADLVVISSPVHNFGVPAVLKCWIDWVLRRDVTFTATPTGKIGLLQDRPVLIAVSSGGAMFAEPEIQPDFFRPYLRAAFGVIGLRNLTFVQATKLAFESAPLETVDAAAERWIAAQLDAFSAQLG